jgi:hypothetical protein
VSMDIRKLVRKLINETLTQDTLAFKRYLRSSDKEKGEELADKYGYKIEEFFENEVGEIPEIYSHLEGDYVEMVEALRRNNPEMFDQFCGWLMDKFNQGKIGSEMDKPSWSTFDEGELIRNQWLVHFTDMHNAYDIAQNGFTIGVDNMDRLGWTTYLHDYEKERGGYNFAYHWKDAYRYGSRGHFGGTKYGNTAVIFMASGVKTYHYADEEPQVVFYGNTAKHINVIYKNKETDEWEVAAKNRRVLFSNERLDKVIEWFVNNYNNFRSILN